MVNVYEFHSPTQVHFGAGVASRLVQILPTFGSRVLFVTGNQPERAASLLSSLNWERTNCPVLRVQGEPTVDDVRRGVLLATSLRCDVLVGLGGGSAIDAGKAIAAIAANGGDPMDYLEVVGKNRALRVPSLPFLAVPTTAGTGAEVTKNAVLDVPSQGVKVSLRSVHLFPRIALVDPELTLTVPASLTATTGFDALTQVLEPFVSVAANSITDGLARTGLKLASSALLRAYQDGSDRSAREEMAQVSLLGGLCLANGRLGAVHGMAGPLGGMFRVPHGVLCAALLPHVMRANIQALNQRDPSNPALLRYREVAQILTGDPDATPERGATWVAELAGRLGIESLEAHGVELYPLGEIVKKSLVASSMRGNPIELLPNEIGDILRAAF